MTKHRRGDSEVERDLQDNENSGPVDILIFAVAVRRKWSLLANDARS